MKFSNVKIKISSPPPPIFWIFVIGKWKKFTTITNLWQLNWPRLAESQLNQIPSNPTKAHTDRNDLLVRLELVTHGRKNPWMKFPPASCGREFIGNFSWIKEYFHFFLTFVSFRLLIPRHALLAVLWSAVAFEFVPVEWFDLMEIIQKKLDWQFLKLRLVKLFECMLTGG